MDRESHLSDWLLQQYRPGTQMMYLGSIRQFQVWAHSRIGEDVDVAHVTTADIDQYQLYLKDQGLASSTITRALASLRAWFAWAIAMELRPDNPVLNLKRNDSPQVRVAPKELTEGEIGRLLQCARKTRYPKRTITIVTLLLQTGLRISELVHANWEDIEVGAHAGTLTIRRDTRTKQRIVPLSHTARHVLWDWACHSDSAWHPRDQRWSQSQAAQLMDWIRANPSHPLFVSQKQNRLNVRTIQAAIQNVADMAGLTNTSPHTLRHTFAFQLLKAGCTLVEVAQLLGHSTVSTTQRYVDVGEAHTEHALHQLQKAIERIESNSSINNNINEYKGESHEQKSRLEETTR